jgi:proteasome accessory factor B
MSAKSERLLNLVVMLMRGGWVTRRELRATVPDYRDAPTEDSFQRMFERDKAELRDLGIPMETGPEGALGDEVGYRVRRGDYALPDVALDADDLTMLALAARVWEDAALAQEARIAAVKLGAVSDGASAAAVPELDVRLPSAGEWFDAVYRSIRDRVVLSFEYRNAAAPVARPRSVEPWALVSRAGAWYIVGRDVDRGEARAFRTSRIQGDVRQVGQAEAFERPDRTEMDLQISPLTDSRGRANAELAVRPGAGQALRRRARSVLAGQGPGGSDLVTVPLGDEQDLARDLVALGGAAVAVSPPSLIAAVTDAAQAVLSLTSGSGGGRR